MDALLLRKRVKKFVESANEKELKMIYRMFEVEQEYDWWDELPKDTQTAIEKSIKQADEGKTIAHTEVMKRHKQWLKK